jgi:hypothetical protein
MPEERQQARAKADIALDELERIIAAGASFGRVPTARQRRGRGLEVIKHAGWTMASSNERGFVLLPWRAVAPSAGRRKKLRPVRWLDRPLSPAGEGLRAPAAMLAGLLPRLRLPYGA